MVDVEDVIKKVAKMREEFANHALTRPNGTTAFDYGRAVGQYTGLSQVEEAIAIMLAEDAHTENLKEMNI